MIETENASISKINKDTVKLVVRGKVTQKEYESFYSAYCELTGMEKDMKFLIIIESGGGVKKKIVDFFKKDYRVHYKKAEAWMIISPFTRMFLKILMKAVDRKYPIQHFDTEESALEWLASIK
ncbi:MAG: STAS/SEC14 domain-containing protein [Flavobacteriales bacterium]|jgi:hypothetical protein|nr:STAS/SEC14 domain-containing protein [Flavobacteriales bacterium]